MEHSRWYLVCSTSCSPFMLWSMVTWFLVSSLISECHRKCQQEYQTNVDLSLKIRMLAALAFVPVDDIVESFEHLAASMPDETQPITDYFEDTYIGRLQRHGRRQPPFAHTMWSVHNRVEEGLPRTNNHVEGWHRRMQSNVGAHHPSIWHFLNVFVRREQSPNEVIITQIQAGQHHHNVANTRPSVSA